MAYRCLHRIGNLQFSHTMFFQITFTDKNAEQTVVPDIVFADSAIKLLDSFSDVVLAVLAVGLQCKFKTQIVTPNHHRRALSTLGQCKTQQCTPHLSPGPSRRCFVDQGVRDAPLLGRLPAIVVVLLVLEAELDGLIGDVEEQHHLHPPQSGESPHL